MGTCMVGWAHSRFGRLDGLDLEALIGGVGVEKMTGVSGAETTRILGNTSYVKEEAAHGLSFPGIFALMAQAYFERHGEHSAMLAEVHDSFTIAELLICEAMGLMGQTGEMQVPGAKLAGVFNMGGSAVAGHVSIRERAR